MFLSRRIKKLWAKLAEPGALRVLYHGLALAPRLIVRIRPIAARSPGLASAACCLRRATRKPSLPVKSKPGGAQRAETELRAMHAKVDALTAELDQRQQRVDGQGNWYQMQLENSVAVKEAK